MTRFERRRPGRCGWARRSPRQLTVEELAEALAYLDSRGLADDALSRALANQLAKRMAARTFCNGDGRPTTDDGADRSSAG
jgi:hypothetical protein